MQNCIKNVSQPFHKAIALAFPSYINSFNFYELLRLNINFEMIEGLRSRNITQNLNSPWNSR